MRLALAAGLLLVLAGWAVAAEPRFADYPAGPLYTGRAAAPILDSKNANDFRTRLRATLKQPVNFGGHYSLSQWGCGTTCGMGAVIDKITGRVVFFPGVCCTEHFDEFPETIVGMPDSNLLLLVGQINEEPPDAKHYYRFDGSAFIPVATVPFPVTNNQPNVNEDCSGIASDIRRLECYDAKNSTH